MIKEYYNTFWNKYHQIRGVKLLQRNLIKKARFHFEKALMHKESYESYYCIAICFMSHRNYKYAITYFEKVLEKLPEEKLTLLSLTECYLITREWEKAEDILNMLSQKITNNHTLNKFLSISNDPILREKYAESKEYYFNARDEYDNKNYDLAYENILKAIELNTDNASYHYFAGIILLTARKPKNQLEIYFENAVRLSPENITYKKQLQFIKTKYKK
ncbi:MAG: CDC27 family protein [Candidatus Cloacimonetes bacterium]|jgi:tetratricopeptide (TPR) repeat protein|nr:hypothetical protein [Candidatus Cloacimonadota bacterium]MDD4156194.1 CDC27 family protein [Candidatus Cloacimonadota bacterium]